MFASIPSGPQYSLTFFPQCWHLISNIVHSVSVPSSSKMRRLHLGFGHLIISICHRLSSPITGLILWLLSPPLRTDMEQGNQPVCRFPFIVCVLLIFFLWCFMYQSRPTESEFSDFRMPHENLPPVQFFDCQPAHCQI